MAVLESQIAPHWKRPFQVRADVMHVKPACNICIIIFWVSVARQRIPCAEDGIGDQYAL